MKKTFFYGYVIVSVIILLQLMMVGHRNSFGVFINPLSDEFGWSRALISGAFSLSTIVMGISSILMGWLNDKIGPRIVTTICGILVGTSLMLMYFVHSAWQLYLCYSILIGLGMGGVLAPQVSTVTRWFVSKRNIMLGLLMTGGGLGSIIGPLLITWIIYTYSWREAFLFVGMAVFIVVVSAAQFLKRDPYQMGQTPYRNENETLRKMPAVTEELSLSQALRTQKFWLFSLILFCAGFCMATISVHIVPLSIDRGNSATSAATILSIMNMAMAAGSLLMGLIADKIGSRKMLIVCVCLISGVMLFLLPVNSVWILGIFGVVMALGGGGMGVLEGTIVAELFGLRSNGVILGVNFFIFTLGFSLGAFTAGLVFDQTGNYQWSLLLCTCLIIASIIMALSLNRRRKTAAVVKSLE